MSQRCSQVLFQNPFAHSLTGRGCCVWKGKNCPGVGRWGGWWERWGGWGSRNWGSLDSREGKAYGTGTCCTEQACSTYKITNGKKEKNLKSTLLLNIYCSIRSLATRWQQRPWRLISPHNRERLYSFLLLLTLFFWGLWFDIYSQESVEQSVLLINKENAHPPIRCTLLFISPGGSVVQCWRPHYRQGLVVVRNRWGEGADHYTRALQDHVEGLVPLCRRLKHWLAAAGEKEGKKQKSHGIWSNTHIYKSCM